MFVKENMLNGKFCLFGWSLRIHYYCFLCSGGKPPPDRVKMEVYGYEKRENSINISFNFNRVIPYRISVWLVSFV